MQKTILITGATDGIGLETAKILAAQDHHLLLHGRNSDKLESVAKMVSALSSSGSVNTFVADLSDLQVTKNFAQVVLQSCTKLDVLINNAGVFGSKAASKAGEVDLRFRVNTIAPFILTKMLLPLLGTEGRVVNLSSAAQSPVNSTALSGQVALSDNAAYAQSKLALTMWSMYMGKQLSGSGPAIIAVNPKSFLGSKMVQEAYGMAGGDLSVGANILIEAALSDEFADATGRYFDNDIGQFANPHPDAQNQAKCESLVQQLETFLA